ncbi:sodium channel protein Nach-like [Wyeomyia smithii]|uniref:sodium channel protein Nach-like n=1 Tax=Wyeomyia smithii TaxID=174621 RepID=UPI002467E334|nr:sodium channel protein Nach-like [Wyeomyia smithii]
MPFYRRIRTYLSRFTWLILTAGLAYTTVTFSRQLTLSFIENPLTFSIDTAYLHWDTTFPAVTVCQVLNDESIADLLDQEFGQERNYKLDSVISDVAFYGGTCFSCEDCTKGSLDCPKNLSLIVAKYRLSCTALLANCFWQNEPFDCCQLFLPLETEFGECYSINTLNSARERTVKLVNNRHTGPGVLRFEVREDLQIYLHDEYAVPFADMEGSLKETVLLGTGKEIIIRIIGMENHPSVEDIPIGRRGCRFPWEISNEKSRLYNSYSYASCAVECFMATQMQFCNCSHHLMPKLRKAEFPSSICDYAGLTCLTEKSAEISKQRKQCSCSSSCVEPEFIVIYSSESEAEDQQDQVIIRMLSLPESKFVRNALKTKTDLFTFE